MYPLRISEDYQKLKKNTVLRTAKNLSVYKETDESGLSLPTFWKLTGANLEVSKVTIIAAIAPFFY